SEDPDTSRIWWTDAGVHQNLTFAVHPDPVSGSHCWHQKVMVEPARPEDRYGDVLVSTVRAREVYAEWLAMTRPAPGPDALRRPPARAGMRRRNGLLRPYGPDPKAYRLE